MEQVFPVGICFSLAVVGVSELVCCFRLFFVDIFIVLWSFFVPVGAVESSQCFLCFVQLQFCSRWVGVWEHDTDRDGKKLVKDGCQSF